ncbi:hypothetical protein GobsT_60790 [Gemmata obscuriglobus]|uniref:DUF1559 domain-containing protein n=1 Tax=Gemmata obscuriglobus TaxID=114 RepID=A0A2Z3GUC7_9BACT|nr:DUF1559 domain-containing protein [Gemmata obscuriglobus]QEG31258.1 hypothetical protein GobsT_60790 [Gemmata obscuriglobus]VTS10596.1 Uncharacterized protein OS=Blastopirellula marina DSM 3645 GN=DSM3645_07785 PE=4 SV=1: SBP_bac_10 [Gemmata obscuriglobus UQM 2246]
MTGPFQLGTPQRVADFTDGLSHVIFVGEKQVHIDRHGYGGLDCSIYDGEYPTCSGRGVSNGLTTNPRDAGLKFGSRHTGVVQFGFGDGRVQALSVNIDRYTFELLGTRGHGQVVPNY